MQTSESAPKDINPPTIATPQPTEQAKPHQISTLKQQLLSLTEQLPHFKELRQFQQLVEQLDWLNYFQRCSRLLVAVIEPTTMTLKYANDYFCRLAGIAIDEPPAPAQPPASGQVETALHRLLSRLDSTAVRRLYRRHLLHLVFRDFYQVDPQGFRLLDEPVMVTLTSPLYPEPRYVEFWLRSEQLTISRLDPQLDEFANLGLQQCSVSELEARLADPGQLQILEQHLRLENYRVEGRLLLEGLDVTEREITRRITQLLIDRDSILQPQKFAEVDQQMRSLFRADKTVVISIEADQTRLFMGAVSQELDTRLYSLESLQNSHFMRAVATNQVITVPDLALDCQTDCGRQLLSLGVRALLLIPLVSEVRLPPSGNWDKTEGKCSGNAPKLSGQSSDIAHTVGLIGLMSDRPNNFDGLDCRRAEQLIPAFTSALTSAQRQLVQQRFITNIHPAVEWKFMQEAERRSLGLPPEPIVFNDVYPLYGISDIRGSSDERNRAIQADLLEQFRLGLAVVEAACADQETALGEQLRLDLLEQIEQLQAGITVDAEVSCIRYLRDHLEIYFDYFAEAGEAAIAAVNTYRAACDNDHGCIYRARARYDEMIGKINGLLRETWDRWQVKMQRITSHYCDIEATDGIDHMVYAGQSIDPKFGNFHLRSLRYEQLRAVCDCARTAFSIQEHYGTKLQVTHLVLVQDATVDIFHDENTERLFDVRGSRDTRYEIVKKRIDKAIDLQVQNRITQPGRLTIVYSTDEEWMEYQQYLRYLMREGWVDGHIERGAVQPLQGVSGLKYARVQVLPAVPKNL